MGKQGFSEFSATDSVDDTILINSVQGAFYGSTLPAARIEAMIAANIPRKHIDDVADVYLSKWWDYRRMSPGHSYMFFAHCYYRGAKIAARKFISERPNDARTKALYGSALVETDASDLWDKDKSHITGMWRAMLVADAFGIPYPEYVRIACRVALERMWKKIPRPHQLYSDTLAAIVIEEWESLLKERVMPATHPLYKIEHYADLKVQDDYREYLIGQIEKQPAARRMSALSNAIYIAKQIPEDLALQHFSSSLVNRARVAAA